MPGRTFEDMQKIRTWIEAALEGGEDSPARVLEWIDKRNTEVEPPSIATIARIMRDMGYEPTGIKWEKVNHKKGQTK